MKTHILMGLFLLHATLNTIPEKLIYSKHSMTLRSRSREHKNLHSMVLRSKLTIDKTNTIKKNQDIMQSKVVQKKIAPQPIHFDEASFLSSSSSKDSSIFPHLEQKRTKKMSDECSVSSISSESSLDRRLILEHQKFMQEIAQNRIEETSDESSESSLGDMGQLALMLAGFSALTQLDPEKDKDKIAIIQERFK